MYFLRIKYKTVLAPLLAAVFLASSLVVLFPSKTAAAGETYEWDTDARVIVGRGGQLVTPPPPLMLIEGPTSTNSPSITEVRFAPKSSSSLTPNSTWNAYQYVLHQNLGRVCTFEYIISITNASDTSTWATISTTSVSGKNWPQGTPNSSYATDCANLADDYTNSFDKPFTIAGTPPDGVAIAAGTGGTIGADEACYDGLTSFGWILCPMNNLFMEAAVWIDERIMELLFINACRIFNNDGSLDERCRNAFGVVSENERQSSEAMYDAWRIFRNIAYALLIILGLIMIISQIMGLEIFDAYTIRKMLPKIVVVAIILPLLWPILRILTVMFNDAGTALMELIRGPFDYLGRVNLEAHNLLAQQASLVAALIGVLLTAFLALGVVAAGAWSVLVVVVIGLLIAVIQAIVVLTVRDMAYFLGILVSSAALVTAVFEPLKAGFAFWRRIMTGILLSIPAVAAVLAVTKVLAAIAFLTHPNVGALIAAIVAIAGYFLFWRTLKSVDKTTAALDKAVDSVTGGAQKLLSNYRNKRFMENLGEMAAGRGLAKNPFTRTARSIISGMANIPKIGMRGMFNRDVRAARLSAAGDQSIAEGSKAVSEKAETARTLNDDFLVHAAHDMPTASRGELEAELRRRADAAARATGLPSRYAPGRAGRVQMASDIDAIERLQALGEHTSAVLATKLPATGSMDSQNAGDVIAQITRASLRGGLDEGVDQARFAMLWGDSKTGGTQAGILSLKVRQGTAMEASRRYLSTLLATNDEAQARRAAQKYMEDQALLQNPAQAMAGARADDIKRLAGAVGRRRESSVEALERAHQQLQTLPPNAQALDEYGRGRTRADGTTPMTVQEAYDEAVTEFEHSVADTVILVQSTAYLPGETARAVAGAGGLGYQVDLAGKDETVRTLLEQMAARRGIQGGLEALLPKDASQRPIYQMNERDLAKIMSRLWPEFGGIMDRRMFDYGNPALTEEERRMRGNLNPNP